jgi:hypothetical protein
MSIQLQTAYTALEEDLRNIGNVGLNSKLRWANTVNEQIYDEVINRNPSDYALNKTIQVVANTVKYARATNFKNRNAPQTGVYKTTLGGTDFGILNFDSETGTFTAELTVTGGTSGATATIDEVQSSYLVLSNISGEFEDDETITDTSTGSASVNGELIAYNQSSELERDTEFGSQNQGFYEDGNNLVITPKPTTTKILIDRYIPKLDAFTALTNTFVDIPYSEGKYLELIVDLLLIQYYLFDRNDFSEQQATARANSVLYNFFNNIDTQPRIYTI